jgi:hypothetical protein
MAQGGNVTGTTLPRSSDLVVTWSLATVREFDKTTATTLLSACVAERRRFIGKK